VGVTLRQRRALGSLDSAYYPVTFTVSPTLNSGDEARTSVMVMESPWRKKLGPTNQPMIRKPACFMDCNWVIAS